MRVIYSLLLLIIFSTNSLLGECEPQNENKIYINSNFIKIKNSKLFIDFDDVLIQFFAIHSDEAGLYVLDHQMGDKWICKVCEEENDVADKYCWLCTSKRGSRR